MRLLWGEAGLVLGLEVEGEMEACFLVRKEGMLSWGDLGRSCFRRGRNEGRLSERDVGRGSFGVGGEEGRLNRRGCFGEKRKKVR